MLKITEPKKVLCIHDLSGVGRCSLAVILPVLSVMGVQPVALPTVVLSTHTGGFGTPARLDGCAYGEAALEHYRELGLSFDCIYTGYLGGEEQAALADKAFDLWPSAYKVVDPVMGDNGELYTIFTREFAAGMRSLCEKADIIVPNLTEAALLLDEPFHPGPYTHAYIESTLRKLGHWGPKRSYSQAFTSRRINSGRPLTTGLPTRSTTFSPKDTGLLPRDGRRLRQCPPIGPDERFQPDRVGCHRGEFYGRQYPAHL